MCNSYVSFAGVCTKEMTVNHSLMYNLASPNASTANVDLMFHDDLNDSDWLELYEYYLNNGLFGDELNKVDDFDHFDFSPLSIALIVLYSLVFVIGLLGNVCVIIILIKFKSMRTLTNVFLVNLTVGDILVILICVPLTLGNTVYRKWVYGGVMCKLLPFIQGSAIGVSVLSMLAISISRYFAIYKPLTAKIVFSKRNVRILLCFIWVVSFGSFSPLLYVTSVTQFGIPGIYESKVCEEKWDSIEDKNIYNLFIFSILFAFPFIIMGIAYIVIGHTLWHGNTILFNNNDMLNAYKKTNLILKQRRRTVKMLICVMSLFGICWLPYYCINIWIDFNLKLESQKDVIELLTLYIYPLVLLLGLANSAVNPICYYFMSRGFKRGFKKMLCFGMLRRRSSFLLSSLRLKNSSGSDSIETADI